MDNTELKDWLVNYFGAKLVPSKIDPEKFTCVICNDKLPKEVRGKAYKWSDTEVCIGSFANTSDPVHDVVDFFNKVELVKFLKMVKLKESHELLLKNLKDLIKCIRAGELGDYSPLMDEIFDSEHAIKEAEELTLWDTFFTQMKTEKLSQPSLSLTNARIM